MIQQPGPFTDSDYNAADAADALEKAKILSVSCPSFASISADFY